MSTNAINSASIQYVDVYDNNGNTIGSIPKEDIDKAIFAAAYTIDDSDNSDKFKAAEDDSANEKINIDYIETDGNDDGKLSGKDIAITAFKGITKIFTTPFTEAAKGNWKPALATLLSIAGFSAAGKVFGKTAVLLGGGALGLVGGGAQTINGISKVQENWGKEDGKDGETKKGIEEIAQGLFTIAGSTAAVAGGVKSLNNLKAHSESNFGSLYEQNANGKFVAKEGVTTGDKLNAYWQDRKNTLAFKGQPTSADTDDLPRGLDEDTRISQDIDEGMQSNVDDGTQIINNDDGIPAYDKTYFDEQMEYLNPDNLKQQPANSLSSHKATSANTSNTQPHLTTEQQALQQDIMEYHEDFNNTKPTHTSSKKAAPTMESRLQTKISQLKQAYKSESASLEKLQKQEPKQGTVEYNEWLNNKTNLEKLLKQKRDALDAFEKQQADMNNNLDAADTVGTFMEDIFRQYYNTAA